MEWLNAWSLWNRLANKLKTQFEDRICIVFLLL
jgi:hypothetical protein